MGQKEEIRRGIMLSAKALGIDPTVLATVISYETKGTFNPIIKGPTTQYGQHEGLIQFGKPQARSNGVDWKNAVQTQLGPSGAVVKYLRNAGVRPGMGLRDVYSAVNAGRVGRYGASDANNGGAPGTVADKVKGMGDHRRNAIRFMGGAGSGKENFSTTSVADDKIDTKRTIEEANAAVANQGPFPDRPGFQPKNASIVPHTANTDRDVASRDTNKMNPNDLIQQMMAAGGRQSTNVEDMRPPAEDAAMGKTTADVQDDQLYQQCVDKWIKMAGRNPESDKDFAEIEGMMTGGDPGYESNNDTATGDAMDDPGAAVLNKMGEGGQADSVDPRPMEPDDSMGSPDRNDPAYTAAVQQWTRMHGKAPATDMDMQEIDNMVASVKRSPPTGRVVPPAGQGGPSDPREMILQKMLGGANR